ncbi:hypothetical protein M3Y99_00480400 [Aphelenchoides fujianensis]|nr:hypothetical protein M3Y99_00480400 [Aphelenchoides fujianensis]
MNRPNKHGHQKSGRRGKRQASDQQGAPPRQRARFEQPLRAPQWNQPPGRDYNSHYKNDNGGQQRNYIWLSHTPAFHHQPAYSHNRNGGESWRNPPNPPPVPFGNAWVDSFGRPPPPLPLPFGEVRGTSWRPDGGDFQRHDRQPHGHQQQRNDAAFRSSDYSNRNVRRPHRHPKQRVRRAKMIDGEEPGEIVSDYEEEPAEEAEEDAVRAGAGIGKRFVELDPDAKKAVEKRLRHELGLAEGQVPEFVLRMFARNGPDGLSAGSDRPVRPLLSILSFILFFGHVRVNETPAFFGGTVENILPKRRIAADTLPAFRGFTHVRGEHVEPAFVEMMNELAAADHKLATEDSLERSGIEEFRGKDERETSEKRKSTEIVHFDVPQYEVGASAGYFVANETKTMSHTIEGFASGIQPFEHSTPTQPTGFLQRLRALVNNARPAAQGVDVQMEEGELE